MNYQEVRQKARQKLIEMGCRIPSLEEIEEDLAWQREQRAFDKYMDDIAKGLHERYTGKVVIGIKTKRGFSSFVTDLDAYKQIFHSRLCKAFGDNYFDRVKTRYIVREESTDPTP